LHLPLIAYRYFNPDFSLEKSARRAATHLLGVSGVNPACPAVAVATGGTSCEFCLSAEQAGSSIAKFGLNPADYDRI